MLKSLFRKGDIMITETIDLYEYFKIPRPDGASGYLKVYCHSPLPEMPVKHVRSAMLIVAGGGYEFVSQREDEPVAIEFLSKGFNCFSLMYTVKTMGYPVQLTEICMAMGFIRENAEKYSINPEHISAVGFSAGGHLVGLLAERYDDINVIKLLRRNCELFKPNAIILSYAVLDFSVIDMKHATRKVITNGEDKKLIKYLDIVSNVSDKCPPAFIWATKEDNLVNAQDSLKFALEYQKLNLPYELHIFEKGWHGLSLGNEEVNYDDKGNGLTFDCRQWVDLAVKFLKNHGFELKYIK